MTTEAGSLTGHWTGYYLQANQANRIDAELTQVGTLLYGTMTDHNLRSEWTLFEATAAAGLPPGADEELLRQLQARYPEAATQPIRVIEELPPFSDLTGEVTGNLVRLIKVYRGALKSGYRIGDRYIGDIIQGHTVHYRGEVCDAGNRIEGQWWIAPLRRGETRLQGNFSLQRQQR